MKKLIEDFLNYELPKLIGSDSIYNEFSLQHELGIYLRKKMPGYKVQFERNATYFGVNDTVKHEIDIAVFREEDKGERYAIELKYPKNGQYPEEMYQFIKDIRFMEQVKKSGFTAAYCITLVDDPNFYSVPKRGAKDGIYQYFRTGKEIPQKKTIKKPTGDRNGEIILDGEYNIEWLKLVGDYRYYFCVI